MDVPTGDGYVDKRWMFQQEIDVMDLSTGATESIQGTHWGTVTLGECANSRRMCRQEIGVPTRDESLQLTIEFEA